MGQEWWRGAVLYQVYPRSYLDTTGDGVGDLNGITAKLDYIASLGVEGIWICPFFKSPMKDFGYDIADYRQVDPLFGTLADFQALLDRAHDLGLKVLVDMVLSHTSDQHAWFQESKRSRDNAKADWYVWADPAADGGAPNNWRSVFGGSAWQFDPARGQYYLHNFLTEQPDLNYHNPEVAQAMVATCRFWLDLGVDGLRLDVINFCTHDAQLRDNPPREKAGSATQLEFPDPYSAQMHIYDKSRPENFSFIRQLRALLDDYPGTMALAEIGDDDATALAAAYSADEHVLHTAYSFAFMMNKGRLPAPSFFRQRVEEQAAQVGGQSWPSWAFSNHDVVRAASRWSGTDYAHDPRLSKLLIALLCSLRGTAFLYQGEELGLPEAQIPYDFLQDPWGKALYPKWQGRDGARAPMPWDAEGENLGFSQAVQPWLPIAQSYAALAVSAQEAQPDSTLNFTRAFLAWRREHDALTLGDIAFISTMPGPILAFQRCFKINTINCVFNLSDEPSTVSAQALGFVETIAPAFASAELTYDQTSYIFPAYGFAFFESI